MYIHVSITSYASEIISCQEYTNKRQRHAKCNAYSRNNNLINNTVPSHSLICNDNECIKYKGIKKFSILSEISSDI